MKFLNIIDFWFTIDWRWKTEGGFKNKNKNSKSSKPQPNNKSFESDNRFRFLDTEYEETSEAESNSTENTKSQASKTWNKGRTKSLLKTTLRWLWNKSYYFYFQIYLWYQYQVTIVWNTRETGNMYAKQPNLIKYNNLKFKISQLKVQLHHISYLNFWC